MAVNKPAPTNLLVGAELGVDRSLYFRWTWNEKNTDHYEVRWEYTTGNQITNTTIDPKTKKKVTVKNDIWFTGSESNVNVDGSGIATYNYPANAKKVRVKVKAVAKENSDSKPYWTSPYSKWILYTVPAAVGVAGPVISNGVSSLTIRAEKNSGETLRGTWLWSKSFTDFFDVKWYYTDGTGVKVTSVDKKTGKKITTTKSLWYLGNIEQVVYEGKKDETTPYSSTFNLPQSAKRVKIRVDPISKIKEETDTLVRYYWNAQYRDVDFVPPSREPPEKLTTKPSGCTIRLQNGTSRGLIAYWNWSKSNTDHYEYRWEYTTGDKRDNKEVYYSADSGSTTNMYSMYTLPDNATRARFVVTPICKPTSVGKISWVAQNSGYIYSPIITKLSSTKVKNLQISEERGSESSLVATWDWSEGYTDHYEVRWLYKTGALNASGGDLFYKGTTESTNNKYSTYSIPSNATVVYCKVLPIAKAGRWVAEEAEVHIKVSDSLGDVINQKTKITDLSIYRQDGTARTFVATWSWKTDLTKTDHYEVEWRYLLKSSNNTGSTNTWVRENVRSTADAEVYYDIYNAPENTDKIQVRVRPIAKKTKVQGIDTFYWTASWCEFVYFDFNTADNAGVDPPVPQTPSVMMNGLSLIASVNIYDEGADVIEFDIVKDDSSLFRTAFAKVIFNHAEISVDVAIGGEYKVRARALRVIKGNSADSVVANATSANSERGDWSEYSENVGTIPATPEQILSHLVESASSVYLQWSEVLNITGYKIEYTENADYFDESSEVTSISTDSHSAYHVTGMESGKTYFFRVCAVNNNGQSGWSPIYSFKLGTRPNPPTTWSDTTKGTIGDDLYLYWTHNSEDKSSQQNAQVELTIGGETFVVEPTYLSDGSIPSYYIFNSIIQTTDSITDDSGNDLVDSESEPLLSTSYSSYPEDSTLLWRVRTMGILDEWSDWSTQRVIVLYSDPTIALYVGNSEDRDDRAYEITKYPLYIYAEAFPKTQKAVGYSVSIIANEAYETIDRIGNIVSIRDQQSVFDKYYPAVDDNILDITLSASDVNLDNGITYTVTVVAAMNSGLSGSSDWTFAARWDEGGLVPDAEVTINTKTLCAYIRPYCVTDSGEYIINTFLSVYRIEYDGQFVLIAENISNGETTVVDPHPALNYARYRVVSMNGDNGEIGFRDIPGAFVGETAIVIQWDEAWANFDTGDGEIEGEFADPVYSGSMLKLPYNVEVSDSNDIDVALNEYIGRAHPVSYYGTQLGIKGSWNAVIPRDDIQTLYALRRLAIYRGDVYVREPSGVGYWANINVSFSRRYSEMTIPVSLNVTRVEGGI